MIGFGHTAEAGHTREGDTTSNAGRNCSFEGDIVKKLLRLLIFSLFYYVLLLAFMMEAVTRNKDQAKRRDNDGWPYSRKRGGADSV